MNNEGYCALALALMADYQMTIEEAFDYLAQGKIPNKQRRRLILNDSDKRDMVIMRNEGLNYDQIASVYGVHRTSIHRHVCGRGKAVRA